jgi:L-amino acid N-acyltransferase YncA
MIIRSAQHADAADIARLYNPYILSTTISFEEEPVSPEEMLARMQGVQSAGLPWIVAQADHQVLGYAYASKWKARSAYRFAVESSVYIAQEARGGGIGTQLYEALLSELKASGMHIVIGGIALPNEASVQLHEKMGYEKVAHFKRVGFKFEQWVDVGYWQRHL